MIVNTVWPVTFFFFFLRNLSLSVMRIDGRPIDAHAHMSVGLNSVYVLKTNLFFTQQNKYVLKTNLFLTQQNTYVLKTNLFLTQQNTFNKTQGATITPGCCLSH